MGKKMVLTPTMPTIPKKERKMYPIKTGNTEYGSLNA